MLAISFLQHTLLTPCIAVGPQTYSAFDLSEEPCSGCLGILSNMLHVYDKAV